MTDPERSDSDSGEGFQSRDDGQLHFEPDTAAETFPVMAPENASPLEEDEPEGAIPLSPLLAMKERRHEQWPHLFGHPERIRACIGEGDATVYAMDDGKHHCMLGRRVGATLDGCVYSLTARVSSDVYRALAAGNLDARSAFLAAGEGSLSGTVETPGVSNVFAVAYYQRAEDIPGEYLPLNPFIEFAEDLPFLDD